MQKQFCEKKINDIELVFIFGSYAADKFGTESDIDLFIVGDFDEDEFASEIINLEAQINKDINYHIYTKKEAIKKLKRKDPFLNKVFRGKKVIINGNIDEY